MIRTIKKYLELVSIVLKFGRWRHSGENFNQSRKEELIELQEFIPTSLTAIRSGGAAPFLWKNPIVRNIVVQLAFFKKSLHPTRGHLTVGNLSYVRIPKSASTSMSKGMLEKIYPALKQKAINEKQINYLTDVNLRVQASNSTSHTYFTIVRNPLSRLVSVYRGFFEGNSKNFIYRDYLFGVLPQNLSFSDFVDRLTCIPDRLKDQHLKPQHRFLEYYEGKKKIIKIFKLEDSEKVNQFLDQNNLQLPHLNKNLGNYDYRSYFNTKSLNAACKLYQADIERFGYKTEAEELKEYIKAVH